MPEGPEVRRITDKLRSRLSGRKLLWISWKTTKKYSPILDSIYPNISHLFPTTCLDIICKGKQLFFFFDNGLAFISSLGMEGHWYYFPVENNEGLQKLDNYKKGKNYRILCLHFGNVVDTGKSKLCISDTNVWYDDMIKYGNFTICDWKTAFDKMETIGNDLLSVTCPITNINEQVRKELYPSFFAPINVNLYSTFIKNKRRSNVPLCKFLMNPNYFSGIGNYLKSEILYRARLHPGRVLGSLIDDEIAVLYNVIVITIKESYLHGGLTHGTFLDPDMEKGTFPLYVYKRRGEQDPYGYIIQTTKIKGDRTTYFVPELQK